MAVLMVAEAMAGVLDHLVGMTTGFKLISGNHFRPVGLLPRETEMVMSGLQPSSCFIRTMEIAGKLIRMAVALKW